MKKELTHIAPLRLGIILAVLYGILSLFIAPFFVIAALLGAKGGIIGIGMAIMLPIIYAVIGFIGGVLMAAIYNLVTKWTGGLEFTVRELGPAV